MSDLKEKREIAQSEARDKTAKMIAGLVPLGSAAYELMTTLVLPLHEKRRREFINDLGTRLNKLEEAEKIDLKELAENEEFNTIITKAILLAQQNHQEEKLEALRNIVLNSTEWLQEGKPIFDWSHKFLMIVDQISPLHMLLLKTFQSPAEAARKHEVSFDDMIKASNKEVFFKIFSDLKDRSALAAQCWKELYSFGFVARNDFDGDVKMQDMSHFHSHGKLVPQTTDFGNKFLDMIEYEEEI